MKVSWSWFTNLHLPGERIKKLAFSLLHYEAGAGRCSCPIPVFRLGEVSLLGPRIDRALLMNTVQTVPYYSDHWRELAGELLFFDPRGIDWERDRIHGLQLRRGVWRRGEFAFPRTIYNRCFPEPRAVLARLKERVGEGNIFNLRTQLDKWEVYQLLRASPVGGSLPATYLFDPTELPQLLAEHRSLILKPRRGHGGAGVFRLTLLEPELVLASSQGLSLPLWGEAVYPALLAAAAPQGVYLAQAYIDTPVKGGLKFDVRLLLQKDGEGKWQKTGELSRVAPAGRLLTNGYLAVLPAQEVVSGEILEQLAALSRLAAQALDQGMGGLGELGIDFLLDREGRPWILEVNGKPDKGLFWKVGDGQMLKSVYLTPLHYQEYLLESRQVP